MTVIVRVMAGREGALTPEVQLMHEPRIAACDSSVTVSGSFEISVRGMPAVCGGRVTLWMLRCLLVSSFLFFCVGFATVWRSPLAVPSALLDMHM